MKIIEVRLTLVCLFSIILALTPNSGRADANNEASSKLICCKLTIDELKKLALNGNADAQFAIASSYENGLGIRQDHKKAVKWYEMASKQGHTGAQHNLAIKYRLAEGTEQDFEKAFKLDSLAANKGYKYAQNALANDYIYGHYVQKNADKALFWYLKAAKNGSYDAEGNLGRFYEFGWGGQVDYKKAMSWYLKSNRPDAQNAICRMYRQRSWGQKNLNTAYKWCKISALNGNVKGMIGTGYLELMSLPVDKEKNLRSAMFWWEQAVAKGELMAIRLIEWARKELKALPATNH